MMLHVSAHETSDSLTSRDSCTATLKPRLHDTTGCQTRCHNGLYRVYTHPIGCQTGLTTDWLVCLHNTAGLLLSNRLCNRFGNRLKNLLTTGCIV